MESLGAQPIDEVKPSDVSALRQRATRQAQVRSNERKGRYAGESAVRAMRMFFRLAIADGLLSPGANPAMHVEIPRRLPTVRRALTHKEVTAINHVVVTTGEDVALDSLLMRLHLETACRRSGALGIRLMDVNTQACAVRLREKFGTERWQPISPTTVAALTEHARERGARLPDDRLLRYSNGRPLTGRRYDLLWKRVRARLPWAATLGVSMHWMRHTTLTWSNATSATRSHGPTPDTPTPKAARHSPTSKDSHRKWRPRCRSTAANSIR
ncbi:tyrosine-type recombinase/integrase [Saccharothrix sp. ALI-22-I]|uniref:tyrosine-type recombinase/integrase n=1 Tax=Saccharothrix sp. ALI-22-I TaxID=1933778 RepID=UPI001EE6B71E|nr:site-specific integrase [Saccharothrix sp. ALI-22-I]